MLLLLLYGNAFIFPFYSILYLTPSIQVSPAFPKFALCYFIFTKDLHQYLFSLIIRNPKKDFHFSKTRQKSENSVQRVVCSKPLQKQHTQVEWHQPPRQGATYTQQLSIGYLNLLCASFGKVCPKATAFRHCCIQKVSFLHTKGFISAYKRFHRHALLSDRGEICTYVEIKPTSIKIQLQSNVLPNQSFKLLFG